MDLVAFEAGAKKNCPIYEFLGLQVLKAEDGVFKALIPNTKASGNHIGIMLSLIHISEPTRPY